jgi:hypothetical protein
MTTTEPQRSSLTRRLAWFIAGLAIFAAIGVAGYFSLSAFGGAGNLLAALGMLALTAGLAIFAIVRGNIMLGSGLMLGYAFATLVSSGQCTLWSASNNYGFLGGFIYYGFALGAGLVLLLLVFAGETFMRRRQGG